MGPTAAGKTALVLALHDRFPVDVISVDSSQVYRGMDIGTAKPTADERARVPHRLLDIRDPVDPYSAADFRIDARREIAEIAERGRIPLLVGGTMFYFHALEYGISALPAANPEIREQLYKESQEIGWPRLHQRLQAIDRVAAERIDPHDAQRIQRALEILELTGRTLTDCYQHERLASIDYNILKVGIFPRDRGVLHARIGARFHAMLTRGFVAEVDRLRQRGDLGPELPAIRTVGYRQIWQYLTGLVNYNDMIERGVSATRQLAKRQLTWLRGYEGVHYLYSSDRALQAACIDYLASKLDGKGL